MIGQIDKNKKVTKSKIFLCKPNRETIAELPEAYQKNISYNSNGVHELTFQIPYVVEKNHEYIRNDHVDLIRGHFLIRYEEENGRLWFVINKPKPSSNEDGIEVMNVDCFLLPYQLNKKIVRNYQATKKIYDPVGSDGVLNDTLLIKSDWTIDYIDADIALLYRTFDISEKSLLDFILSDIVEAFDCIILWDTDNKRISIFKEENIGIDRGLSIENGKYLKSIEQDPDFDNVVTRLYIYGKDGISIQSTNPSGSQYIEDFSYYMFPFDRDDNRNVLRHSTYMSDSLCHAILDYNLLLESKKGQFETYLNNKSAKQDILIILENELFDLQTDLEIILDSIDIAQATGQDTTQLLIDKENKQTEISNKQSEINGIKSEITSIDIEINLARNEVSKENNFTHEQLLELENFVYEKTWTNNFIDNEIDLLEQGKKELNKVKQPIVYYSIDSVHFLKVVECQRDWDKLKQFDIVTIKYPTLNIYIKAKIINIKRNDDENSLSLEIANVMDISNGIYTIRDLFKNSISTSTALNMSKFKWDKSESNENEIRQILENKWESAKREITGGVNETVTINERGITITDSNDPLRFIRMTNSVIGMTSDGGNTFKLAIDPSGVYAEHLVGQIIAGQNLAIVNESGKYSIDAEGFIIEGGSLTITGGLPESQINSSSTEKWNNSIGKGELINGVKIDTSNGLTVTRSDDKVQSIFNSTDGIKVKVKEGTNWIDKFYFDVNTSNLVIDGEINARSMKINGQNVLTQGNTKIGGQYIDQITTDQIVAGTAKISKSLIVDLESDLDEIETKFSVQAGEISSKVSTIDYNGNTIASLINQTATTISINASKINLNGAVTFNSFNQSLQDTINSKTNSSDVTTIVGNTVTTSYIEAREIARVGKSIQLGNLTDFTNKSLRFNNSANISAGSGSFGADMSISADNIEFYATRIDFNNANVTGLNVTATLG